MQSHDANASSVVFEQHDVILETGGRFCLRFAGDIQRGDVRPLANLPPSLEATCRALKAGQGVEAIRALAFPVKPQQESKNPQRPG